MKLFGIILFSMIALGSDHGAHQFEYKRLSDGKSISLDSYKGKKVLIVNTASECGYTPQYKDLEAFYKKYGSKVVVLGFPTNDFGAQEPGSNEEIAGFCKKNYGVSFPMSQKITVKGSSCHPLYQWLTQKKLNGKEDSQVKWNFQKYLIDENGKLIAVFPSSTLPEDPGLLKAAGL